MTEFILERKMTAPKNRWYREHRKMTDHIYSLQVSADQQGICVPITPGRTNGSWLNSGRNLFIKIPNVGKTFDAATYPNGIYDAYGNAHTQNSVFNIEDDSTITVKGDEVTVTLYSGSTSYDKMYIGKVGDSDEAKDAKMQ